jgi:hypothetical protein
MSIRLISLCLLSLTAGAFAGTAFAQTWSAEQQEVWRFEEQQWKMAAAKDLSWVDTMVHPNVSVWGNAQPAPQDKASLARWSKYDSSSNTVLEQDIFPISIVITGNIAVVNYRYMVASENYKKERETVTGRYMDILVKESGRWLFLAWAGGDDPKK